MSNSHPLAPGKPQTVKDRLRAITNESWSQHGSMLRCGPLGSSQIDSAVDKLYMFDLAPDEINGRSLQLPIADTHALATMSEADFRTQLAELKEIGR